MESAWVKIVCVEQPEEEEPVMGEILRRFRETQTWMEPFEAESAWVVIPGAD